MFYCLTVAFEVHNATGQLVSGVPTFTKVLVNVGNAYDNGTGKFTYNKDGLYSITFILRSQTSSYVYCYIRLNGAEVNYATATGSEKYVFCYSLSFLDNRGCCRFRELLLLENFKSQLFWSLISRSSNQQKPNNKE